MRSSRQARAALIGLVGAGLAAIAVGGWLVTPRTESARAAAGGPVSFQPVLGTPADTVRLVGAAPQGDPGEAWAFGKPGVGAAGQAPPTRELLRFTTATGAWQLVPLLDGAGVTIPLAPVWQLTSATPRGGLALAGPPAGDTNGTQELITRDPGGPFVVAPAPVASGAQAVLTDGETLVPAQPDPGATVARTLAAIDDGGHTGALVAPVRADTARAPPGVLHYDGSAWSREAVCEAQASDGTCTPPSGRFSVSTLVAAGGTSAWMLVDGGAGPVLYQRVVTDGAPTVWLARHPRTWLLGGAGAPAGGTSTATALTPTPQGVWVDATVGGGSPGSATVLVSASVAHGDPLGRWCYPVAACGGGAGARSLGAPLPDAGRYASVAFAGSGAGDPGTRVISALPDGALLRLDGAGDFAYTVGVGVVNATAAFTTPDEGWLEGSHEQLVHVTTAPEGSRLRTWPVPFRYPLLAVVAAPGATSGDASAQALAVGDRGEIARYLPGQGWQPEFLYGSSGARAVPRLRGVAWPEPDRAYAVGDEGAMWVWNRATDLWGPDPAKPLNFHGQLTGVAFQPGSPTTGYAVGKQGVLLSYGRSWVQEPLPPELQDVNFSSIAFAGAQPLATYRWIDPQDGSVHGGVAFHDATGWHVDAGAAALAGGRALSRVAGLPDGGAVLAGPGVVLERDTAASPWRPSVAPLPQAQVQNVSALAAIRDGAAVRALVSIDSDPFSDPAGSRYGPIDNPAPPAPGQPPNFLDPDPLPIGGTLLRETANGWHDDEHGAFSFAASGNPVDGALAPDPVLALAIDPGGAHGWAVGGDTAGQLRGAVLFDPSAIQTASVARYGDGVAPPSDAATDPIGVLPGQATFALGGGAQCAQACADAANIGIGPDAWLSSALARAAQVPGVRGFLYAGGRLPASAKTLGGDAFGRELARYAALLGSAGSLPVHVAASPSEAAADGSTTAFAAALGAAVPAGTAPAGTPAPPAGTAAYAFDSAGAEGTVRVIVLDDAGLRLSPPGAAAGSCSVPGQPPANQLDWLCAQLDASKQAHVPAIVLGNADIVDPTAANAEADAAAVQQALLAHGASAYLFESTQRNVQYTIGAAPHAIPALGTGTLGYVTPPLTSQASQFLGDSGFLLVSVDAGRRDPGSNVAPVSAMLTPNAGALALDATDGLLLRRSSVSLFRGLARRPLGGSRIDATSSATLQDPDLYIPIPNPCIGAACAGRIPTAYRFSSSRPDVGDFVAHDPNSTNARAVLQGADGRPVADPTSGVFCAFNAGTTTVTVTAGGLRYSAQVTVRGGSVQQPCGTVPLTNPPPARTQDVQPRIEQPPPPTSTTPAQQPLKVAVTPPRPPLRPIVPVKVAPPKPPAKKPPAKQPPRIPPVAYAAPIAGALVQVPVRGALPPPPASPARPTPPSGTSQVSAQSPVSQPVGQVEEKREEEVATELMHHMSAYHPGDPTQLPWAPLVLLLVVTAAGAGAGLRGSRRSRWPLAYAQTRREPPRSPRRRRR